MRCTVRGDGSARRGECFHARRVQMSDARGCEGWSTSVLNVAGGGSNGLSCLNSNVTLRGCHD